MISRTTFYYQIDIKFSKYFLALHFILHLFVTLITFFLDLPWLVKLLIIFICWCNFFIILWRFILLRAKNSILKIWQESDGQWYLLTRNNNKIAASLRGNSFISKNLIILNFAVTNKWRKISVVLFAEIMTADEFRRLNLNLFSLS